MSENNYMPYISSNNLPQFDGTSNVSQFIKNFNAKVNLITDDASVRARLLKDSLKGDAWERYLLYQNELKTCEQVESWLNNQFAQVGRRLINIAKLQRTNQSPGESVASFTTRILSAWQNVFGATWSITDEKAQQILLGIFYNNLNVDIVRRLPTDFEPANLDEMITKARQIEADLDEGNSPSFTGTSRAINIASQVALPTKTAATTSTPPGPDRNVRRFAMRRDTYQTHSRDRRTQINNKQCICSGQHNINYRTCPKNLDALAITGPP